MTHFRHPVPPSTFLPPLKHLHSCSTGALSLALQALSYLYQSNRPIFPARISPTIDSGYASDDETSQCSSHPLPATAAQSEEELKELWQIARSDPLERDFATCWMTGFLARGLEWVAEGEKLDETELEDREVIYEGFSSLLGSLARASEAGAILRQFTFERHPVQGEAIKVVLLDKNLSPTDHTSVGLQTWGSASIMAQRIVRSPHLYGLFDRGTQAEPTTIRILELGAGTGLLSLVVQKLLVHMGVSAQLVATDYHPDVLTNLECNVAANVVSAAAPVDVSVSMTVASLEWEVFHRANGSDGAGPAAPFDQRFDIILGADVVYQPQHAQWLASVARKLLKKPDRANDTSCYPPAFHLIAANRATRQETYSSIGEAFPSSRASDPSAELAKPDDGLTLCVVDSSDLVHVKGVGRADESGYREYTIGWC